MRTNGRVTVRTDVDEDDFSFLNNRRADTDKNYYSFDHLGSVTGIYDDDGDIEEKYGYDAFGKLVEGRFDCINKLVYNGKMMDAYSVFYDYGFRDYSPVMQRFTTVDPIRDGLNWYSYVLNDPVNRIDLWGLEDINFLFTFKSTDTDRAILDLVDDTVYDLKDKYEEEGYSVLVDEFTTEEELLNVISNDDSKVVVIIGHSNRTNGIQTSDKQRLTPSDIDDVGENLALVVLEGCQTSLYEPSYSSAFGEDTEVVNLDLLRGRTTEDGYERIITDKDINDFNKTQLGQWIDNSIGDNCKKNENT